MGVMGISGFLMILVLRERVAKGFRRVFGKEGGRDWYEDREER